eukprot:5966814-Pleurochrysis_carterae.AAC.1
MPADAEITLLNPLITQQTLREPMRDNILISRTLDDYVSGPGVAVGLQTKKIRRSQVRTIAPLQNVDDHAIDHWAP